MDLGLGRLEKRGVVLWMFSLDISTRPDAPPGKSAVSKNRLIERTFCFYIKQEYDAVGNPTERLMKVHVHTIYS